MDTKKANFEGPFRLDPFVQLFIIRDGEMQKMGSTLNLLGEGHTYHKKKCKGRFENIPLINMMKYEELFHWQQLKQNGMFAIYTAQPRTQPESRFQPSRKCEVFFSLQPNLILFNMSDFNFPGSRNSFSHLRSCHSKALIVMYLCFLLNLRTIVISQEAPSHRKVFQ